MITTQTSIIALLGLLLGVAGMAGAADPSTPTPATAPGAPLKGVDVKTGRTAGGCCTMWTNGLEPCKQWTTPCPPGGGAAKVAPGSSPAGIAVSDPGVPSDKPRKPSQ